MLLRDGPGFGVYFAMFEVNKRKLGVSEKDRVDHNYHGMSQLQVAARKFISGGVAGCATWTVAYPADTLKTRLQSAKTCDMSLV